MRYLFSEQSESDRANEHVDPRVVAADDSLGVADGERLSKVEQARLARGLDAPGVLYGTCVGGGNVWHLSLSTKAGVDRVLSDAEWAEVARETMRRLGFAGSGTEAACRWVAVRHGRSGTGNDHMHVAVNLVREDGRVASVSNDYRKLSRLCRDMEVAYGLVVVEGRAKMGGMPGVSRAEAEKAKRVGRADPERVEVARMVRAAACAARSEAEFVRRLRAAGLAARPRYDRSGAHRVVGYSVAQAPSDGGVVVFFAGGSLAKDLRLPALRDRWVEADETRVAAAQEWGAYRAQGVSSDEGRPGRYRVYEWAEVSAQWGPDRVSGVVDGPERAVFGVDQWAQAGVRLGRVVASLAEVPASDEGAWRAVAADAAGVLAGLSGRLEQTPGPLARASDVLARSAQGRDRPSGIAVPAATGTLRAVAAVAAQAQITDEAPLAWQLMLTELLRLAQSLAAAHAARAEAVQAGRLAGEARAFLDEARAGLGSAQRVAELVASLTDTAERAETAEQAGAARDDRPGTRRRSSAAGMRPEDYAALAAKNQSRHEPSRAPSR